MVDWLMSLSPRWAERTFAADIRQRKTWELRTRAMRAERGDTVWIYASKPMGRIVGYAEFHRCRRIEVKRLMRWPMMLNMHQVPADEVRAYAGGRRHLEVIVWNSKARLRDGAHMDIDTLRTYGVTPSPTWVRLVDRPDGDGRGMRGSALFRELRARLDVPREVADR